MTNYLASISWWTPVQRTQFFLTGLRLHLLDLLSPVLAAVQFPILGMDFLQQNGLLVDVGKHQLIMTASMKVIRAVAPSGGPGGLYTAVASSSTGYGPLFAEYVIQHKEE